jgi:hypothetical protein
MRLFVHRSNRYSDGFLPAITALKGDRGAQNLPAIIQQRANWALAFQRESDTKDADLHSETVVRWPGASGC